MEQFKTFKISNFQECCNLIEEISSVSPDYEIISPKYSSFSSTVSYAAKNISKTKQFFSFAEKKAKKRKIFLFEERCKKNRSIISKQKMTFENAKP